MRLVDEAIVLRINDRLSAQKFFQERRSSWPINASEPCDNSATTQHKLLGLAQNFTGFMLRGRNAFFCHQLAIHLCVHARAAREHHCRLIKSFQKIARAFQVNAAVKIDVAAARARTMDHGTETLCACGNLIRVRNVDRNNRITFVRKFRRRFRGRRPTFNLPTRVMK